jgi:hypothetical protein
MSTIETTADAEVTEKAAAKPAAAPKGKTAEKKPAGRKAKTPAKAPAKEAPKAADTPSGPTLPVAPRGLARRLEAATGAVADAFDFYAANVDNRDFLKAVETTPGRYSARFEGILKHLQDLREEIEALPQRKGRTSTGGPRLGGGELRSLVLAALQDSGEMSPTGIANRLDRSSGAVANALEKLVEQGQAVCTSAKPRRYKAA